MVAQPLSSIKYDVYLVDTPKSLSEMVEILQDLPIVLPSLYLKISCPDTTQISSVTIVVPPNSITYVVDIRKLGDLVFSEEGGSVNLRSILESDQVPKVLFDARQAAAALQNRYSITISRVHEVQMMELAARERDVHKERLGKLDVMISTEKIMPPQYEMVTNQLATMRFDARTLALPELWQIYNKFLKQRDKMFWISEIRLATKYRLDQAKAGMAIGGRSNWDKEMLETSLECWNDDVFMNAQNPELLGPDHFEQWNGL